MASPCILEIGKGGFAMYSRDVWSFHDMMPPHSYE